MPLVALRKPGTTNGNQKFRKRHVDNVDGRYTMFMRQTYTHAKGKQTQSRVPPRQNAETRRDPMNLSRGRITASAKDGGS